MSRLQRFLRGLKKSQEFLALGLVVADIVSQTVTSIADESQELKSPEIKWTKSDPQADTNLSVSSSSQ
jgi:hypothetical protein